MFDSESPKLKAFLEADKKRISASAAFRAALAEFWDNPNSRRIRTRLHKTEQKYLKERAAARYALHEYEQELKERIAKNVQ